MSRNSERPSFFESLRTSAANALETWGITNAILSVPLFEEPLPSKLPSPQSPRVTTQTEARYNKGNKATITATSEEPNLSHQKVVYGQEARRREARRRKSASSGRI